MNHVHVNLGLKVNFGLKKKKEARCWLDENVSPQHTCWLFPQTYKKTQFWLLTLFMLVFLCKKKYFLHFLSIYGTFYCFLLFYGESQPSQIKIFFIVHYWLIHDPTILLTYLNWRKKGKIFNCQIFFCCLLLG